ncbi:MAG: hypothetical protein JOZ02_14900 [Acidobacteria bacterium]|nr:hypothetical protein [Acidobacteriota bacterium]
MQQEVTIVEIDWTEAVGAQGSVGSPYLFGWLRAAYVQPGLISDGRVVVLARKNQSADWEQYQGPVTLPEADTLVSALAVLGIPERGPRVEMVLDSSDTWFTSSVRMVVGEQAQTFTIQTQSSGFGGQEADGLRAVFRRILDLSGYGQQQSMFG